MKNKFELNIDSERIVSLGLTSERLITLIEQVDKGIVNFIILTPEEPIKGTDFLQYAISVERHYMSTTNGKLFSCVSTNMEEVITIFLDYYKKHNILNTDDWQNIKKVVENNMLARLIKRMKRKSVNVDD